MAAELIKAMVELREKVATSLARELLQSAEPPENILDDARKAMEQVGKNFEAKIYFLPELMMAGEIMKQVTDQVKPFLMSNMAARRGGKIILGTVEGDIHDIGKDIVLLLLNVYGFEVIDLSVDVPAARFIAVVKQSDAHILGLSGFLYFAHLSMKATIDMLEKEGLRGRVKVMVGGGQVDENVMKLSGADAWGRDAMDAVNIAKRWIDVGAEHGNGPPTRV